MGGVAAVATIIGTIGETDRRSGGGLDKKTGGNYKKAREALAPKPKTPPVPPIPLFDDLAAGTADKAARERQRQRAIGAYGRSDTILTTPLGLLGGNAPAGQRKTLLGM